MQVSRERSSPNLVRKRFGTFKYIVITLLISLQKSPCEFLCRLSLMELNIHYNDFTPNIRAL